MKPRKQASPALAEIRPRPAGLERPMKRDQRGLKVYDLVAQKIVDQICPETVLDVGCAMGLLVERLRRRRVEAVGIDPEEALLDQADPKIRPFLTRADYTDRFPEGPYSLIVSIEALTDLPPEIAAPAIRNICSRTEDVIFSARPPALWAGLFAENGFFRDTAFDASFISPWAARFRLHPDRQLPEAIREYEHIISNLGEENASLRARVDAQEQWIERTRVEHDSVIKTLVSRLQQWESLWADIERSAGWKFLHRVRLLRMRVAPPGSRRAALLRIIRDSVVGLQEEGLGAFFRSWRRGFASEEIRIAPGVKTVEQINAERYPDFVERTTPGPEELERQRSLGAAWEHRPLVSFVTPVYNPSPEVLRATLDSVLAQTYDHWELCVVDASQSAPDVRQLLEAYMERDNRIRLRPLDHNLGISGNSNVAIGMASGEYIAILDHDDVLAPHMLFEVVSRIRENHLADVIYFDEDKLSEDGLSRRDPFFKPDFSPEMLMSANYMTHAVYRRSLVENAGRFDVAYDGCQDWDLAFKITEQTQQVEHIPKVLYHWRQVSGSTAGEFAAKSYVFDRQLRCVQDHLRRIGLVQSQTYFPNPGFLRAMWPVSGGKVSVIIPTKDKIDYLKRTIESIRERTSYPSYEIIIVDNGSRNSKSLRYFEKLRSSPDVRIVDYKELFNYSRANNLGAQIAEGDYLLFLNNDVEILHEDWMEEMVRWAELPDIGVVGV